MCWLLQRDKALWNQYNSQIEFRDIFDLVCQFLHEKKKKTSTKHRGSTVWILFQVVNLFHQSNARFRSLTDWDKTSASCANHGQNKEDNKDKIWIVSKRREKIARHGSHSSPCMCSEFSKSNPKRLYIFSLFYSLICHLTQMAGPRRDIHLHVKWKQPLICDKLSIVYE